MTGPAAPGKAGDLDSPRATRQRMAPVAFLTALILTVAGIQAVRGGADLASTRAPRPAGPTDGHQACDGSPAPVESDLQQIIDDSPEGATLCIESGIHRIDKPLNPKAGQQLLGRPGAVLNGAKVITNFHPSGMNFEATGFLPATPAREDEEVCRVGGCSYAQDIYLDGLPLSRVLREDDLGAGGFYEDFAQNRIVIRDDPTGHIVEQAYAPSVIESTNADVTVRDLVIEKSAGVAQESAALTGAEGWLIENNEVRFNHTVGVECAGCTIRRNYVHHNGQLGLAGVYGQDQLVEENEVAYNNTAGYNSFWAAGGSKFVGTTGLVVRRNYFHHNSGSGLWTDGNNVDSLYDSNYVSENGDIGIFHEKSYSAKLINNVIVGNGFGDERVDEGGIGAGIRIAQSSDVIISGNTIIGNRNGIVAFQQAQGDSAPTSGPHEVSRLSVQDNEISMTVGVTGLYQLDHDPSYFSGKGNGFRSNHYHLDDAEARRFMWADGDRTAEEWTRYGQDTSGSFDTAIPPVPAPPARRLGPGAPTAVATVAADRQVGPGPGPEQGQPATSTSVSGSCQKARGVPAGVSRGRGTAEPPRRPRAGPPSSKGSMGTVGGGGPGAGDAR